MNNVAEIAIKNPFIQKMGTQIDALFFHSNFAGKLNSAAPIIYFQLHVPKLGSGCWPV